MPLINLDAVLNPLPELKDHILDYIPRATTSEFGIVALGSGINVDTFGRIYLDTQEYSDRLTAIETTAASTLETTVNTLETKADELATSITQKLGMPNGIATLDSAGNIPASQLPSYVDDVLEYESVAAFPATGVTDKIYVETTGNTTYRWSGTTYVKITSGEVSSVAGKKGIITLTKDDVGLSNVDNTSDLDKPLSTAAQTALTALENKGKRGILNLYDTSLIYGLNERVQLATGDIVKSTINGNTNDPNVNMTGWFNESSLVEGKTKSFLDFGAKGDGVADDSISIGLASTWSSMYKRKVSGLGKEYKCSNVFFDSNCYLADAKLINNVNADLISVLTTAVSRDWLENVTFENIHIDGKRIDQTGVKDSGLAEDGGRHGFRFRRPCKNIRIRKSSANFCASDGICLFPDMFNGGDVVSIIDFVIEDSEFNWNRRHGGSSDRTNGLTLINTKCNFNGRYLEGYELAPQNSGAQGDKPYLQNYYYGNGWDSEEYDSHTYSSNLNFINCEMIDNAKGGLLILATAGATAVNENIKILGGKYNKGVLNSQDIHAITLTPNTISATNVVYENVVISAVTTKDSILLRNTRNYSVTDTPCILAAVEYSTGYSDGVVTLLNGAASAKNYKSLIVPVDGFKYNQQFNVFQIDKIPVTLKNTDNFDTVQRDTFTKSGVNCGHYVVSINNDNSTSYNFKTTDTDGGTLKVDPGGVVQKLSPYHMPPNNSEMTFDLTSNTNLRVLVRGSDGVVRSANIPLA